MRKFPKIILTFFQKPLAFLKKVCYNTPCCEPTQGYSSAGRVPVSKTVGRGFESSCPCQKKAHICLPRQCVIFSTKSVLTDGINPTNVGRNHFVMKSRFAGRDRTDLISSEVADLRFHPSLLGFHRAKHDFIDFFFDLCYNNIGSKLHKRQISFRERLQKVYCMIAVLSAEC